jgi:ketosteroid isomerase-like protein
MKPIIACWLLALSCAACKQPANDNEALVRHYFALFNQHDWQGMANLYADTAQFKDPSLGRGIVPMSRAQIVAKYQALQKSLPDVRDDIAQLYPAGPQHIVVEFVSRGTLPDSSQLELPICTIFTIRNGKIAADFTYYDEP